MGICTTGMRSVMASKSLGRRGLQHIPVAELLRVHPREVGGEELHDFAESLAGGAGLEYLSHQAAAVAPELSPAVNVGKELWNSVQLEYETSAPIRPEQSCRNSLRFCRGKFREAHVKKTAPACTSRASRWERNSPRTQSSRPTICQPFSVGTKTLVRRRISARRPRSTPMRFSVGSSFQAPIRSQTSFRMRSALRMPPLRMRPSASSCA